MPVQGIIPSLLEVGKVKIGVKGDLVKSARGVDFRPPKKIDHFIVTTNERDESGDYIQDDALMAKLKESGSAKVDQAGNLVGIPIRLLYNDLDLNFQTRYVCYQGAKVLWYSNDGITIHTAGGRSVPFDPAKVDQAYQGADKGKINGKLSMIIDGAQQFGGAWVFRTTSYNTVKSILGSLSAIKLAAGGRLAFLPLMLIVQPKSTTIPGSGAPTTVHIVSVIWPGSVAELRSTAIEMARGDAQFAVEMAKVEVEARKLLDNDNIEDARAQAADIVDEFYPETVVAAAGHDAAVEQPSPVATQDVEKEEEAPPPPETKNSFLTGEMPTDDVPSAMTLDEIVALADEDLEEDIPPTAAPGESFKLKNPEDPTDPENWLRLKSNFEEFINLYINEFNAARLKVKHKAIAKWNRMPATASKRCPIRTAGDLARLGNKDYQPTEEIWQTEPGIGSREAAEELVEAVEAEHERAATTWADYWTAETPAAEPQQAQQQSKEDKPVVQTPAVATASYETLVRIVQAKKSMGITDKAIWDKLVTPYGVSTAKDLTEEQASDLLDKLQAIKDDPALLPT